MKKYLAFYGIAVIIFSIFLSTILEKDVLLRKLFILSPALDTDHSLNSSHNLSFLILQNSTLHYLTNPLSILIIQILTIIICARIFGILLKKIGQPSVTGEIIAGIFLGPSVIGLLFPEITNHLFPSHSIDNLKLFSQMGLLFFIFIVGMEMDLKVLKTRANAVVIFRHSSIVLPYILGVILAFLIFTTYAPANVYFLAFALFIGISMSITAYPVLVRIIQEKGLFKTKMGTTAINNAATANVIAWCLLAIIIAIVKSGSVVGVLFTISLSVGYVLLMLLIIKPLLHRMGTVYASRETINRTVVAVIFVTLLASSFVAEIIGVYALFGAFLAGVSMPYNLNFKKIIIEKIEDVTLVFLLPVFFVYTGLRTELNLINTIDLWLLCFAIFAVAVIAKFGGSAIAERIAGQSWKDALSTGALMNTKGVMALVIFNIGYDHGIISGEIFTILVIVALLTTLMTVPSLQIINYLFNEKEETIKNKEITITRPPSIFNILISFAAPKTGSTLLKLADLLTFRGKRIPAITALHITPSSEVSPQSALIYEKEGFNPIKKTAQELGIAIKTAYKSTEDVSSEIINETRNGNYDLLLVGSARSVFSQNPIGGIIKSLLDDTPCNIGVMIDRGFRSVNKALLLFHDSSDSFLLEIGLRFTRSSSAAISVADVNNQIDLLKVLIKDIPPSLALKDKFQIIQLHANSHMSFRDYDLVLVGPEFWRKINDTFPTWLHSMPTVLLIKPGNAVRHELNVNELFSKQVKSDTSL